MPLADTSSCLQVRLAGMPGGSGIELMSSIMATDLLWCLRAGRPSPLPKDRIAPLPGADPWPSYRPNTSIAGNGPNRGQDACAQAPARQGRNGLVALVRFEYEHAGCQDELVHSKRAGAGRSAVLVVSGHQLVGVANGDDCSESAVVTRMSGSDRLGCGQRTAASSGRLRDVGLLTSGFRL
jgi:hypothetical protein